MKYTSPFAKYLVVLDEASKEKIRQALSLTDKDGDNEAHEENNNEGGDQLTHAIALDASFANAIREAYTTVGAALNELSENFKSRHASGWRLRSLLRPFQMRPSLLIRHPVPRLKPIRKTALLA